MENNLFFELAKSEDADAMEKIAKESFADPWTKKSFVEAIEGENAIALVARDGKAVVAYGIIYQAFDEAELVSIAVDKEKRGKGIGKGLMEKLIYFAKTGGAATIYLEVRSSNKSAIALYESFGFVKDGIRKAFYRDNNEDANVMHLAILS